MTTLPALTLVDAFGRSDIAAVSLLAAAAGGVLVSPLIDRTAARLAAAATGAALAVASVLLLDAAGPPTRDSAIWAFRSTTAIGAALVLAAMLGPLLPANVLPAMRMPPSRRLVATVALLAAAGLPTAYGMATAARLREKVSELIASGRVAEAAETADVLAAVDPAAEVNGRPIDATVAELKREALRLKRRVARPLSPDASAEDRLAAAQDRAMLGDTDAAIDLLSPLVTPAAPDPRACNLLGTIGQAQGEWEESLLWFEAGGRLWRSNGSAEGTAGRVESLLGIGYAHRKLGRPREAEAAYRQAIALAPSAPTHMLLARFYADSQRATDAARHAREAATLDPSYGDAAAALTDRLMTYDFGCLPVFLGRTDDGARAGRDLPPLAGPPSQ